RLLEAEPEIVGEVMAASEDRLEFVPCLELDEPQCGRHTHCSARQVWQRLNRIVQMEMKAITVADVLAGRIKPDAINLDNKPSVKSASR
ncbi:MAG TPA: Rrf2 family transcriptional regulator, partial [Acidobacteriota bacterium]|nr:Rrf2 family transcriptional regulator [Acidobacteriota bacterium]